MAPTPAERRMRAQIAAHHSWAHTNDRNARTSNARKAAMDRFEREVDPKGELTAQERARRAEHARKAYFTALALKSATARRKAREALETATAAEAELDELGGDCA